MVDSCNFLVIFTDKNKIVFIYILKIHNIYFCNNYLAQNQARLQNESETKKGCLNFHALPGLLCFIDLFLIRTPYSMADS